MVIGIFRSIFNKLYHLFLHSSSSLNAHKKVLIIYWIIQLLQWIYYNNLILKFCTLVIPKQWISLNSLMCIECWCQMLFLQMSDRQGAQRMHRGRLRKWNQPGNLSIKLCLPRTNRVKHDSLYTITYVWVLTSQVKTFFKLDPAFVRVFLQ